MSATAPAKTPFELDLAGRRLAGEMVGDGPAVVCAHGITATRRYVLQGSLALARAGYAQVLYDARGHGESDPAPVGEGYDYPGYAGDLDAVIAGQTNGETVVLAGHSMGAHTIVKRALDHPEGIAGMVIIGPVQSGAPAPASSERYWNRLADGLEQNGIEGFMAAYDRHLDPRWREVMLRFTRRRISAHRHPRAVAEAMRAMPHTQPFAAIEELSAIDIPSLIVASHDESDPGHPFAVAEAYARTLPDARLISEREGESPLAWQGGRLSREIATFCEQIGF
ncbi:MAG: alpha/beta fold hydrolase [Solirubrobacterales bacterium]